MKLIATVLMTIFSSTLVFADQVVAKSSCPVLAGVFVCPASSNNGVELTLEITQYNLDSERANETFYNYKYTSVAGVQEVTYIASPNGHSGSDGNHLFCHNDILFCDCLGCNQPHATNYYFIDSKTGNYVAGKVGSNPITCIRQK